MTNDIIRRRVRQLFVVVNVFLLTMLFSNPAMSYRDQEKQEMLRRHNEIMEYVDTAADVIPDIIYLAVVIATIAVLYFIIKKMARKI